LVLKKTDYYLNSFIKEKIKMNRLVLLPLIDSIGILAIFFMNH